MKVLLNVAGVIGVLIGGVWMLQGLDFLGGSFMSGQREWFFIGAVWLVVGVAVLGWANFMRR